MADGLKGAAEGNMKMPRISHQDSKDKVIVPVACHMEPNINKAKKKAEW